MFGCSGVDERISDPISSCYVHGRRADGVVMRVSTSVYEEELEVRGRICADGRFHFVSEMPNDLSEDGKNLNQIAVYGRLF